MSDENQFSSNTSDGAFINDEEQIDDSNVYLDKNIVFDSSPSSFNCCGIKLDSKLSILKHWLGGKNSCKSHTSDELFVIFQLARKVLIDYDDSDRDSSDSSSPTPQPQRPLFDQSKSDFQLFNIEISSLIQKCNTIKSLWENLNK